jgi:hypothetical protein
MPLAPPPRVSPAMTVGPSIPTQDERTIAMLIHLLAILTGIVGPLILWLVRKDSSHYIDHHGKEAVNFQITILLAMLGAAVVGVLGLFLSPLGLFILIPAFTVIPILALIFEIHSCVRANRGEWSRYPINLRLIS